MAARGTPYLAVEVRGTLPQRLLASCAAQAAAATWGRRLLLVWPDDDELATSFDELFAAPSPHALPRIRTADLALFPPRFWANLSNDHHAPAASASAAAAAPPFAALAAWHQGDDAPSGAAPPPGVYCRSGGGGLATPPLPQLASTAHMRQCLASLEPHAEVSALVTRHRAAAAAAAAVSFCERPAGAVADPMVGEPVVGEPVVIDPAAPAAAAAAAPVTAATVADGEDLAGGGAGSGGANVSFRVVCVACEAEGFVRAVGALRRLHPGRPCLLSGSHPARLPYLRARLRAVGTFSEAGGGGEGGSETGGGGDGSEGSEAGGEGDEGGEGGEGGAAMREVSPLRQESARRRCLARSAQRAPRCARLALAELLLLSLASPLLTSVGCAHSAVLTLLAPPDTPRYTGCTAVGAEGGPASPEEHAAFATVFHPLTTADAPPPAAPSPSIAAQAASTEGALTTALAFEASGLAARGSQVVVEHSPEVDALLPAEQRNATLLYVVPRKYTVLAFASRVGAQLAPTQPPPAVLVRTEYGGTVDLPAEMLVSEAMRRHAGAAERLSVRVTWRWAG